MTSPSRVPRALTGFALVLALATAGSSAGNPKAAAQPKAAKESQLPGGFPEFSFTSRKEPIAITSDKLEFDYKSRRTTFRGGVEVVQGDVHVTSDLLTVDFEPAGDQQELRAVRADGRVTITQGARKATGDHAVFDQTTRTMILTGNGVLEEGLNQVKGEKITVYPDESRMEVAGENSRVKVTLFPGQQGPLGKPTPATPQASSDGASKSP